MAISAEFSVNGSAVVQAHTCIYNSVVTFALLSLTGIEEISWEIVGTSKSTQAALAVTLGGTPTGATAQVTMPSDPGDGLGRGFLMKVRVKNQRETVFAFRVFGAVNGYGKVPVALSEENYRHPTHGWLDEMNEAMAASPLGLAGGDAAGDRIEWNGSTWSKRRGYISVSADSTGVVDASTAISNALASARPGQCVFIPDGVYLVNQAAVIAIPPGVTLVGSERGHNTGPYTVGSTTSLGHMGTQLRVTGTSNLFQVQAQASARHFEIYYPNQNGASAESGHGTFSGTPVEHGWTFDCNGSQNPTIENITALNPLDFIRITSGTGCKVSDIWAWPLRNGLQLGRIADVARFANIQFNRTPVLQVYDPALLTWVQANCIGIDNDGAESFQFNECFFFRVHIGMRFKDIDADGFHDVAGSWKGGGFDSCGICLSVEEPNGLNLAGLAISDATLSSSGTCVQFTDTDPAKGAHIHASNVRFQGVMAHAVLLAAGSYGAYSHVNGSVYSNSGSAFHATDATSSIMLDNIGVPSGVGRRTGGAGRIFDANPWIVR